MSVKITYFVHGTTLDNENRLASGQADAKLSKLGIEQAKNLKELLKEKFDVVFTSDLSRAYDTARLAWGNKFEIIQDKRIRECDYGNWTQKKKDWQIKDFIDNPYPNGESYKEIEARMSDLCDYLKNNYNGKHIAIVAHQAPQLALDVLLKGKTWKEAIEEDWRNEKAWKPGWEYNIK